MSSWPAVVKSAFENSWTCAQRRNVDNGIKMNGSAFKDIEKLEADLWSAADNLRANSKLTSSDYFLPVLGIIFLRHAANRYEAATRQIKDDQDAGRMPKRKLVDADY